MFLLHLESSVDKVKTKTKYLDLQKTALHKATSFVHLYYKTNNDIML